MNDRLNVTMQDDAPLTLQTRAALALNSTKTERDLIALAAKNVHIVAVIDKPGRMQCHSAAMELKAARVTINNTATSAREDATQFQRAVIAEAKRLVQIVEGEETRLLALRDEWDAEQARIKAEAEAKERARVTAIHERIAAIRSYVPLAAQCRTAARVDELLNKLVSTPQGNFEEFAEEAATVLASSIQAITAIYEERAAEEAERARAKAEAEAAAAVLAEQRKAQAAEAAKLAAERAAFEEERRIQRESLAAQEAAFKAQQAEAAAKSEAEARQAREAQERADYAAAIAVTPVAPVPAPVAAIRAPASPAAPVKAWRPTDVEIIDALAERFGVLDVRVLEWLRAMDFDVVEQSLKEAA